MSRSGIVDVVVVVVVVVYNCWGILGHDFKWFYHLATEFQL